MAAELGRFVTRTDCRFPYRDKARVDHLIDEAFAISMEAVMHVVSELSSPPRGRRAPHPGQSIARLRRIHDRLRDPTMRAVVRIAQGHLRGQELSRDDALRTMNALAQLPDSWNALGVVEYAVAWEHMEEIAALGEEIRRRMHPDSALQADAPLRT